MAKIDPIHIPDAEARRLVARFRRPLLSFFLRRVAEQDEAEDLTQEVFLRIVRREDTVPLDNPETYIFRIAANLLRDRARHSASRHLAEHDSLDAGDAEAARVGPLAPDLVEDIGPERVLLSQESLTEVMQALDELGDRTRDIFLLCRLDKMKQRDIATLYGMTVSAVEKHIAKAGLHLTRRFGKR
jgi:RNA polymerase sigma-70 factor (ECF subfamily)